MPDIIGTWRLAEPTARNAAGQPMPTPYGPKFMGRVTFNADGRMMAVLCDGRPTMPAGDVREYVSYGGNYSFDGTRLVTRCDVASDPARIGTDQVRDVTFEGNRMILRPPPRPLGGEMQHRVLAWEKISDI